MTRLGRLDLMFALDLSVALGAPVLLALSAADLVWGSWSTWSKPAAFVTIFLFHPPLTLVWVACTVDAWRRWQR